MGIFFSRSAMVRPRSETSTEMTPGVVVSSSLLACNACDGAVEGLVVGSVVNAEVCRGIASRAAAEEINWAFIFVFVFCL